MRKTAFAHGSLFSVGEQKANMYHAFMDEGRKRVVAIVAGILAARHFKTPDDLFGTPQGSPRSDAMIAAAVQWAELIMQKVDSACGRKGLG
jgi:hypothetical protein